MENTMPKAKRASSASQSRPRSPAKTIRKSAIARIAGEIAGLSEVLSAIDTERVKLPPDGNSRVSEKTESESLDRLDSLFEALWELEPETLDDVLTLVIAERQLAIDLIENYADDAVSQYVDPRPLPERDRSRFKRLKRHYDQLTDTIIRGLGRFAASPVVDCGRFTHSALARPASAHY
jgi:hypothetical protein